MTRRPLPMPPRVSCALPSPRSSLPRTCTKRLWTGHRPCLPCSSPPVGASVIQTFAVASYSGEITCLLKAKETAQTPFLQAKLPVGATIAPQRSSTLQVQWIRREESTTADAYWQTVSAAVGERCLIAYRPGGNSCLGVRGTPEDLGSASKASAALAPRWCVSSTPASWLSCDVETWANERGFTSVSSVSRSSKSSWSLRAWPPAGFAGPSVFTSGIVVSSWTSKPAKRRAPESTARPVWGLKTVAEDKAATGGAAPDASTPAEMQVDSSGPSAKAQSDNTRPRSPSAPEPRAKAARTRPPMPGSELFEVRECGGAGDCAFCCVATAPSCHAKSAASKKNLAPGGPLQGFLRVEASRWMRSHPEVFKNPALGKPVDADAVATSGTYADTCSLYALAQALRVQLRVWMLDPKTGSWRLFLVGNAPSPPVKSQPSCVWLCLESQHYRLLSPHNAKTAEALLTSCAAAITQVTLDSAVVDLTGAGPCETRDSAWARSMLGLETASVSSAVSSAVLPRCPPPRLCSQSLVAAAPACPAALLGLCRSAPCSSSSVETNGTAAVAASSAPGVSSAKAAAVGSLDPADPRMLLGLAAPSHGDAASGDLPDDLVFQPYQPGEVWHCKCGWRPNPTDSSDNKRAAARKHWRQCCGTEPPKAHQVAAHQRLARSGIGNFALTRRKAQEKFAKWRDGFKGKWQKAACNPDLDNPATRTRPKSGITSSVYTCSQCQRCDTLSSFKASPCSKGNVTVKIPLRDWQATHKGQKVAMLCISNVWL